MEGDNAILLLVNPSADHRVTTSVLDELHLPFRVETEPQSFLDGLNEKPRPRIGVLEQEYHSTSALQLIATWLRHPEWCEVRVLLMADNPSSEWLARLRGLPIPPEFVIGRPTTGGSLRSKVADLWGGQHEGISRTSAARAQRAADLRKVLEEADSSIWRIRYERDREKLLARLHSVEERHLAQSRILNARMCFPAARDQLLNQVRVTEDELRAIYRALDNLNEKYGRTETEEARKNGERKAA